MHPFRAAVEAHDVDAALALLAPDVVFRSPIVHTPYRGRDAVAPILRAVVEVFEDFEYVREYATAEGDGHVLRFRARVGDRRLEGCDILRAGADGAVAELVVMVRPLSGALALVEAMRARLEAAGA